MLPEAVTIVFALLAIVALVFFVSLFNWDKLRAYLWRRRDRRQRIAAQDSLVERLKRDLNKQ